ncbi:hypothetical protein BH11GEM2_BH11GEM2_04880 [soil metagenome]
MTSALARGLGHVPSGTVLARIEAFWVRAGVSLGRGLTSTEARGHWESFEGALLPANFSTHVVSLAHEGRLVVVGRYGKQAVYASPRAPSDVQRRGTYPDDVVREALIACVEAVGGPVPTSAILTAVHGRAPDIEKTCATNQLWALEGGGPISIKGRKHRVVAQRLDLPGGATRWEWSLQNMDANEAMPCQRSSATLSYRQAVISTVEAARAVLGAPPTRLEWQLYVEQAFAHDPVAAIVRARTGYGGFRCALVSNRSDADRAARRYTGLSRFESQFASKRLTDPRFGLSCDYSASRDAAACESAATSAGAGAIPDGVLLLEGLASTRVDREILALSALEDWWLGEVGHLGAGDAAADRCIRELMAARHALVLTTMTEILPPRRWAAAMDAAEAHISVLQRWLAGSPRIHGLKARYLAECVTEPLGALAAVRAWLAGPVASTGSLSPVSNADDSLTVLALRAPDHGGANSTLLKAIYEARFAGDLRRPSLSWVFRHARQAPNPDYVSPVPGKGRRLDTHRDRVDAWTTVVSDAGAHTAWVLLADADRVLGGLLRDAEFLAHIQASLPVSAREVRRAFQIARGLLGSAPSDAEVSAITSIADGQAVLLASLLGDPAGIATRLPVIARVWASVGDSISGPLTRLARNAMLRVRCDEALHLVE